MPNPPPLVSIEWLDSGQPFQDGSGWREWNAVARINAFRSASLFRMMRETKVLAPNLGSSCGGDQCGPSLRINYHPDDGHYKDRTAYFFGDF